MSDTLRALLFIWTPTVVGVGILDYFWRKNNPDK
jgi:hypothetical protein